MAKEKKGTMKIPGKKLKGGKYVTEDIDFETLDDNELSGFGQPLSLQAAKKMIEGFQSELRSKVISADKDKNIPAIEANLEHPVAITLGKETLLYILTQKDCEGIRFYFCKNHEDELSVVAVGVKDNPDFNPNATLASKAKDLGTPEGKLCILNAEYLEDQVVESQFLFEVGPPTRLKDMERHQFEGKSFEAELREIFSK